MLKKNNNNNNQLQKPLKPLDEYLNEIKKRNANIIRISPAIEQLYNNVSSYDDLFHKLIEETYYIYNELQLQSSQQTKKLNNNMSALKKEGLNANDPIKKALIFKTSNTERSKVNKSKDKEANNSYSPIIPQNSNKSNTLYFTTNQKQKETLGKTTTLKQPTNNTNKTFIGDDLTFLINNSKEIENILLTSIKQGNNTALDNNTNNCNLLLDNNRNPNEDIILKYEKKIFELEKEKNYLIDQKTILEKEMKEIKYLFSQFDWKYSNISDMQLNNEIIAEGKQIMIIIDSQSSKKINDLFSQNLLKEAESYWKQLNYQPLINTPLDRSYEMLSLLSKLKDRELKAYRQTNKQALSSNSSFTEAKKKDKEIVELLANIELYKTKFKDNEIKLNDVKNKLCLLIDDNSILFQENRKLKTLIEINSKLSN